MHSFHEPFWKAWIWEQRLCSYQICIQMARRYGNKSVLWHLIGLCALHLCSGPDAMRHRPMSVKSHHTVRARQFDDDTRLIISVSSITSLITEHVRHLFSMQLFAIQPEIHMYRFA